MARPGIQGITQKFFTCKCHGQAFSSNAILNAHNAAHRKRIWGDLEAMVKEGALGMDPWLNLPGESPLNYNKFKVYLSLPPNSATGSRRLSDAAKVMGIRDRTLTRIAQRFLWTTRARLFDQHVDQLDIAAHTQARLKSSRQQATLGRKLQEVAMAGAHRLLSDPQKELSGNEVAKLADVGVKIERLANSDPTAITETRGITVAWEGPRPSWAPPEDEGPPQLQERNVTTIEGQ